MMWWVLLACGARDEAVATPEPPVAPGAFVLPFEVTELDDTGIPASTDAMTARAWPVVTVPHEPTLDAGVQWAGVKLARRASNGPFRGIPSWKE